MVPKARPRTGFHLAVIAGALFCVPPTSAFALTCGGHFNPLTVSTTGVNFGNYDPGSSSATTSEGSVVIACEFGIDVLPSFAVSLSRGRAHHHAVREMFAGHHHYLYYNLYTATSRTVVWADGSGDSQTRTYDGLLVLSHVELTIYGAIPAEQFVPSGLYSDTIVAAIEY